MQVAVPVLTPMGARSEPGILEGYGPIDGQTARRLAGTSTGFRRILTDPETGACLSFGKTRYDVPAELRVHLRVRDGTCRFPGCNRPARHCDNDHTSPQACGVGPTRDWVWEDGVTDAENLGHLCRSHHRLKHASRWTVTQTAGGKGEYVWTSALGRTCRTLPETRITRGIVMKGLPDNPASDLPPF